MFCAIQKVGYVVGLYFQHENIGNCKKANIYHNFPIKRYEKVRNILFAIVYKHNIYVDLGCFLHFLEFH